MCGIFGVIHEDRKAEIDQESLAAMSRALIHRGPDDEGVYRAPGAALGLRRLSIIDIQGGHQPISNEAKDMWLVCNGEIYSYRELRRSLEHHGHTFSTASDVEVILHAYEQYGEDFLQFINGMFAFALWDEKNQRLIIGRDRTGIKPLYYTLLNGSLVFSSELKSLVKYPGVEPEVDMLALNQYLSFEYVPSPRSIFKDIHKLEPGHILTFTRGGAVNIRRYWNFSFEKSETRPPLNIGEVERQFLQVLEDSVESELMSDVPLGVFLSGGLDSSSIAAIAARRMGHKLKTFNVKFEDSSFDESKYAAEAARFIGTEHYTHELTTKEIVETASLLPRFFDEPLGDSSVIPTLALSKFARQHVKVALGGDGGDELFAGYPTYQAHRLIELYESIIPFTLRANVIPRIVKKMPLSLNNLSLDFKAKRFLMGRGKPMGVRHHLWMGSFTPEEKRELFHADFYYHDIDTYNPVERHIRDCDAISPYNRLLYCDLKLYLEGDILHKVDRASMWNSLEVRVPLLNLKLLDFVSNLPLAFKLRGFKSKYLLKRAMRKLLPPAILNRPKKGFNFQVGKLIQRELKDLVFDYLGESALKNQSIFNQNYVSRLISDHMSNRSDNRKVLWTLLAFQMWKRDGLGNAAK